MYIFLDIDGVLVKKVEKPKEVPVIVSNESDLVDDVLKFDQDCLNEFESVIRQYKQSKIVIDSSWREWFAFETIKALFSNDVADKVIGVTPEAREWVNYFRYYEILDYLKQNNASEEPWVAIDDIGHIFQRMRQLY